MTSIGTLRELDSEVEEAFAAELPCEAGHKGPGCRGTNPARWYGIRNCVCGVDTWCDSDRLLAASFIASGPPPHCNICGADPVTIRWEPIRGGGSR